MEWDSNNYRCSLIVCGKRRYVKSKNDNLEMKHDKLPSRVPHFQLSQKCYHKLVETFHNVSECKTVVYFA